MNPGPVPFVKGHGTENDFVLLPDPDGTLQVTDALVRALCDRRAGLGADGVIRIAPGRNGVFMDYRNADGSVAEMCGNGARVFGRYLVDSGWLRPGRFTFETRGGPRTADVPPSGDVTIGMGPVRVGGRSHARLAGREFVGAVVDVGNPHLVCRIDGGLAGLDLASAPEVDQSVFPNGANVEFVDAVSPGEIAMRVHERGVGETRSCGTGTVAAAAVSLQSGDGTVLVRVPGGAVRVRISGANAWLTGPAVLVARGEIDPEFLAAYR